VYQEVIDLGGEAIKITEYSLFARVTEFKYGKHLSDVNLTKKFGSISFFYFNVIKYIEKGR